MSTYDTVASRFNSERALPNWVLTAIRQAILDALSTRCPRVLDLGCGSGRIGATFVAKNDEYFGVDLSFCMLRAFAARRDLAAVSACGLTQADGAYLPFRDGTFDGVLLMQVLSIVSDHRRLLAEGIRVLCHSGALIVGRTLMADGSIEMQMRQRLDEICTAMGAQSHSPRDIGEQLPMLFQAESSNQHLTAASWIGKRTPRQFMERHRSGARFAKLPSPVRDIALQELGYWAAARFGSLDRVFSEPFSYQLNVFRFQSRGAC
jgi:ubiquinone/menaquinone biosynthesis C-methylase UbiE